MIYNQEQANLIARRLQDNAQQWQAIYTTLNNTVARMNEVFVSQTQAAFNAANEYNQPNYLKMQQLLEEMAQALTTAQQNMVAADEQEAARIRARFML